MTKADIARSEKQLERETLKQIDIIYAATAIALWEKDGWRTERLCRLFDVSESIWNQCGETLDESIMTMLEKETGLEMKLVMNGQERSYKEFCFVNPDKTFNNMTWAAYVYMRKKQAAWLGAGVQAGIFLALHRKYGYGFERLSRVYAWTGEFRKEYKDNPEALRKAMLRICGINFVDKATRKTLDENNKPIFSVEDQLRSELQMWNEREYILNSSEELTVEDRRVLWKIHEQQERILEELRRFEDDGK